MESTVQRKYQVTDNPDGSKTLVFRSEKSASHPVGLATPLGCAFALFGMVILSQAFGSVFLTLVFGIAMLAILFWVFKKHFKFFLGNGSEKTVTLTEQGIIFNNGKSKLNIDDLKSIEIDVQSVSVRGKSYENRYVYAYTLGNKVNITGYFTNQGLADAIYREITNFYPGHFK